MMRSPSLHRVAGAYSPSRLSCSCAPCPGSAPRRIRRVAGLLPFGAVWRLRYNALMMWCWGWLREGEPWWSRNRILATCR